MPRLPSVSPQKLAAGMTLALLAGVWAWWAVQEGAYFGAVLYPGLVLLCAGFIVVLRVAPPTLGGAGRVALISLLALAAWTGLSALWSATPDIAIADAQRAAGYALAFGLGALLVAFAGHPRVGLVPLACAGLVAGSVAVASLLESHDFVLLIDEGTLQFPLGYRNANAAFFLIALWPALTLALDRGLDWRLRGLSAGTATLCLEVAMLSQSRGSLLGAAAAIVVLLAASGERARVVAWMPVVVLPALLVIPALTDLFATADLEVPDGTDELRAAGRAALGGALIATAAGWVCAWLGGRVEPSAPRAARANRAMGLGAVAVGIGALIAFTVATGNPATWVGDRVDEFLTQGTPDEEGKASRFGVNAGSERDDLWRVAVDVAGDDLLAGVGAGGYGYEYLLRRSDEGVESVRDAHSVELEILSELGVIGLGLFGIAIGAAGAGAVRARGLGTESAALAACALTAGAYWLVHASLDWFWTYPALTAPVLALLGSACARTVATGRSVLAARARWPAIAVAAVLALSVIPPFLSERYVTAAYEGWRADPDRAFDDLERARNLNPLSIEPLLARGAIERERGNDAEAIRWFKEAAAERPEEWATHYFLALLYRRSDPQRALEEYRRARELNPLAFFVEDLRERLGPAVSPP